MNDDLLNPARGTISTWFTHHGLRDLSEGERLNAVRTAQQNAILQSEAMIQEQINSAQVNVRRAAYFPGVAIHDERLVGLSNNSVSPSISSHFVGLRKDSSVPVADVEKSIGLSADLWDSLPAQELVDAIVALARGY